MASKKCPKCGEDNPAEAVMCWACYTPLSGSAPLGAGLAASATMPKTGGPAVGIPQVDAPAKKSIDPKTIAVGAVLLVGVLAAVMMSGMMGGGGGDTLVTGVDPAAQVDPAPIGSGAAGPAFVAPPTFNNPGGGPPPAPVALAFKTVATPGEGFATGTAGILVAPGSNAAGAAKFAKDQFARNGRWTNMQVAVFTDAATADRFGKFQNDNKNRPLTNSEFRRLADMGVWAGTPVFLEARGKTERLYRPATSPMAWWPGR